MQLREWGSFCFTSCRMKLFLLRSSQKLFLSQSSQNNAFSGLPVTGRSCFCFTSHRMQLFLLCSSQNEAVSVVWLTECSFFCHASQNEAFSIHTSHRMKLFQSYVSQKAPFSIHTSHRKKLFLFYFSLNKAFFYHTEDRMKLFLLYVSQKEALSVISSQNEAVSFIQLTEWSCFCHTADRMMLFLSYHSQNEALSIVRQTEWSSFCLTAYRMKRFWYVSWSEAFKLLGTTCPTTQCHFPEDWNFLISFVIAGQSYFLYI
jgi:hypothetical protein